MMVSLISLATWLGVRQGPPMHAMWNCPVVKSDHVYMPLHTNTLDILFTSTQHTSTVYPKTFLTNKLSRNNHQYHFIIPSQVPSAQTSTYQTSFYPRTIKKCNQLPTHIIELNNLKIILSQLTNYIVSFIYLIIMPVYVYVYIILAVAIRMGPYE